MEHLKNRYVYSKSEVECSIMEISKRVSRSLVVTSSLNKAITKLIKNWHHFTLAHEAIIEYNDLNSIDSQYFRVTTME